MFSYSNCTVIKLFLMATFAVRFYVYFLEGDVAQDEDLWHELHSPVELRKAEVIATLSLSGWMEHTGYRYVNMILPTYPDDPNNLTQLHYYVINTEEQYQEALKLYRDEGRLPSFGLLFKKGLEKA